MAFNLNPKHLLLGLGVMIFVCMLAFGGFFAYLLVADRQVAYYPGSVELTSHDVFKLFPRFYYRQDTTYLTDDPFPMVSRWYANGFGLGPASQGQSNCISMFNTETTFRLTKVTTVMICDTVKGLMIFTERSWRLEPR